MVSLVSGVHSVSNIIGLGYLGHSVKEVSQGRFSQAARNFGEGTLRLAATAGTIIGSYLLIDKAGLIESQHDYCMEVSRYGSLNYRYYGEPCDQTSRVLTFCHQLFENIFNFNDNKLDQEAEKECFNKIMQSEDNTMKNIVSKISSSRVPQITIMANSIKNYCQALKAERKKALPDSSGLGAIRNCKLELLDSTQVQKLAELIALPKS